MVSKYSPDDLEGNKKGPADSKEGAGTLIVMVSTSAGGYPLANAMVTVFNEEGPQKFKKTVLQTGRDGKTPSITLPAPILSAQELYDCTVRPYSIYTVSVEYPRFYTNIHKDIQIFEKIESIINSYMMPLPANIGQGSTTKIYIVPPTRCIVPIQGQKGTSEQGTKNAPTGSTAPKGGGM